MAELKELMKDLVALRRKYAAWKKEHPDKENEMDINKLLLLKYQIEDAGRKFIWKKTPLDIDAKKFLEKVKVEVVPEIPGRYVFGEEAYATVHHSGETMSSDPIKVEDFESKFKSFVIASPVVWGVGGSVTDRKHGTKNDVDILISTPNPDEIARIISFRMFRMFDPEMRRRLSFLMENKGYLGPFTDNLPLYRLVMERIPNAEIEKMAEIKLRTKGTEKQAREASKASAKDKITWREFFLPQKPTRGYYPGEEQTIDLFVSIWNDDQFPVMSSYKADGINTEWHISDDEVIVYTEDGTIETDSFPESIKAAKKLASGHKIVLLAEVEFWSDGQHYPREVAAGKIHKIVPDEKGIIVNVYDMVFFDEDIHKLAFAERFELAKKKMNFPQSTETPSPEYKWNLIPHIPSPDKEFLKRETLRLAKLKHSEGNVAKQANAPYDLTGRRKPSWIKYHVTTKFNAVCLKAIETKVKGVFNLEWGLLIPKGKSGDDFDKSDHVYVDAIDQLVISGGKTFSTTQSPKKGKTIEVECETFNVTYNKEKGTYSFSAWAPRFLKELPGSVNPDTVSEVEKRAIRDGVFQAKVVTKDKIYYLPGASGEEIPSKDVEVLSESSEDNILVSMLKDNAVSLKFLGSKGLIEESSNIHKYHTGIVLRTPEKNILIDYGEENPGLDVLIRENIDEVVISHAHPDHFSPEIGEFGKPVHMSNKTDKIIKPEVINPSIRKIFKNGKSFKIGDVKIEPFSVLHSILAPMSALRITVGDLVVCISTDILGFHSGDRDKYFEDVDIWIADGSSIHKDLIRYSHEKKEPFGHTAFKNSAKWVKDINPLIILTHLGKEAVEMSEKDLQKSVDFLIPENKVEIAYDSMTIKIKPKKEK